MTSLIKQYADYNKKSSGAYMEPDRNSNNPEHDVNMAIRSYMAKTLLNFPLQNQQTFARILSKEKLTQMMDHNR